MRKPRRFYLEPDNLPIVYADASTIGGLSLSRAETAVAAASPQRPPQTQALARNGRAVVVSGNRPATALASASPRRAAAVAAASPRPGGNTDTADSAGRGRTRAGSVQGSPPAPPPAPARILTVRLTGIAWDRLPASGFAVYLAPRGAALEETSPYFLGTLNLFGTAGAPHSGATHQMRHANYQDFDATRLLDRVEEERLEVRIVPYSLFAPAAGQAAPRADGVRIAEVELLAGD